MRARLALHGLLRKLLLGKLDRADHREIEAAVAARLARARERGRGAAWACWAAETLDVVRATRALRADGDTTTRTTTDGGGGMGGFREDWVFAARSLRKRPGFVAVAVAVLAIGIGADTAIFSLVNALLLRPVPGIAEPERVVEVGRSRVQGGGFDTFTYPDFLDLRAGVPQLEELAGYRLAMFSLAGDGGGERVQGTFVSANYFRALGLSPARGRFFLPEEDEGPDGHPVAVVSHAFWRNRMGGDPGAVGSTLRLNRLPYTVVGVAPPDFRSHMIGHAPAVWVPLMQFPVMNEGRNHFGQRNASWFQAIGRLAPGATTEEADAAAKAVFAGLAEAYPDSHRNRTASVVPLGPVPGGGRSVVAGFLAVLLGFVSLVLVVTCANLAGVFLARATVREKEIAVRLAVGAGRGRLVRQLVLETLAVFLVGGALGVLLAWRGLAALPLDRLPLPVTLELDFAPDLRVLGFALAATLVTGLVFGLLPALQATRLDLVTSLREEPGRGAGRRSFLRRAFLTGQVALSLVLLLSAGLFLRAVQRGADAATGFEPDGTWMTSVDLSMEGFAEGAEAFAFQQRLLESARAAAGVEAAALAIDLPLDMSRNSSDVEPEGWSSPDGRGVNVDFNVVSEGYFETLRIPLVAGRTFTADDREGSQEVAVLSRSFARELWPDGTALGRRVRFGGDEGWATVVGVVEDVKNALVTDERTAMAYFPARQRYRASTWLLVRSPSEPAAVAAAVRRAVLDVDPALSFTPPVSVERYTALGMLPHRVAAGVTSVLGALALLLTGIGLYGVVAYSVAHETREIGVRMALGAARSRVLLHVLRRGVALAVPGLILGALLSAAVAPLLGAFLLGTSPMDPLATAGVGALLLAVVVAACLLPAGRASRTDPCEALRQG